jgi:hypothetical protein
MALNRCNDLEQQRIDTYIINCFNKVMAYVEVVFI